MNCCAINFWRDEGASQLFALVAKVFQSQTQHPTHVNEQCCWVFLWFCYNLRFFWVITFNAEGGSWVQVDWKNERKIPWEERENKSMQLAVLACRLPGGMFVMKCAAECVFHVEGFHSLAYQPFGHYLLLLLEMEKRNLLCTKPDALVNNLSLYCFSTLLVTQDSNTKFQVILLHL